MKKKVFALTISIVVVFAIVAICFFVCNSVSNRKDFAEITHGSDYSDENEIVASSENSDESPRTAGLPVLDITTFGLQEPTCDYVKHPAGEKGEGIINNKYINGKLKITLGDKVLFHSGEYDKDAKTGIKIKIRGNSSAYQPKKSFLVKLETPADLLLREDAKYKERKWVLLPDAATLNPAIGFKTANSCGIGWTPKYKYVNVYMNCDYRGIYLLLEGIEKGKGRCNIEDDGFIVENDVYWWSEENYFETLGKRKYTFKYPDNNDVTSGKIYNIRNYLLKIEKSLAAGKDYSNLIDENTFVSWILAHDLLGTWDEYGSNIFVMKNNSKQSSKLMMVSPWDFDSIYVMEGKWANIHTSDFFYYGALFKQEKFVEAYKEKYAKLRKHGIENSVVAFLNHIVNEEGTAINISRKFDAERWGTKYVPIEDDINEAYEWFTARFKWMDKEVEKL